MEGMGDENRKLRPGEEKKKRCGWRYEMVEVLVWD
jgi:hypothetical protein